MSRHNIRFRDDELALLRRMTDSMLSSVRDPERRESVKNRANAFEFPTWWDFCAACDEAMAGDTEEGSGVDDSEK